MKTKDGMVVCNINSTCTQSYACQHADPCIIILISLMIWMHECMHTSKPAHCQVAYKCLHVDGGKSWELAWFGFPQVSQSWIWGQYASGERARITVWN